MLQYKSIPAQVKDVDVKTRTVTGYFSSFGVKDSDGDIIEPGFYGKSIKENGPGSSRPRIMHLYQHDTRLVLGKPSTLTEDGKGLYFETAIVDTSYGTDVLKLYEAGVLDEHSVGIEVLRSRYDKNNETRHLLEGKLWEGSTVTWGANEDTPFVGFKSAQPDQVLKRIDSLTKLLRTGDVTDDTFIKLEYELQQIKTWASELLHPLPVEKATDAPDDEELTALIQLISTQIKSI
jgi:HK97 family phage prohead protease